MAGDRELVLHDKAVVRELLFRLEPEEAEERRQAEAERQRLELEDAVRRKKAGFWQSLFGG